MKIALQNMYDSLDENTRRRLKECTSAEEVLAIAKEDGMELSEEQIEAVSGGWGSFGSCETFGCSENIEIL